MKTRLILALLAGWFATGLDAAPLGSAFTYQGSLEDGGALANGAYDFEVALFNLASGGSAIDVDSQPDRPVVDGVFNLSLDYTSAPYQDGEALFLELRVRPGASTGAFTTLNPRQPLLSVPYAQHALSAPASAGSAGVLGRPVHTVSTFALGAGRIVGDSSLVTGSDGLPFIAVHDIANGDLVAVHCHDVTCATRTITPIDSANQVGGNPAVVIANTGRPVIGHYDATNGDLRVAFCANVACTSASVVVADANGNVGQEAFALYSRGLASPNFIYYDATNGNLKTVNCPATLSTCQTPVNVDASGADVGRGVSAAFSGRQHYVAYHNQSNGQLLLKVCLVGAISCPSATAIVVDATADSGEDTVVLVPPDGIPLILYTRNGAIRAARCVTWACTSFVLTSGAIDSAVRIAALIGADGMPLVFGLTAALTGTTLDRCGSFNCASVIDLDDNNGNAGDGRPSIALAGHGLPQLTHRRGNNLSVITCGGNDCDGHSRR